MTVIASHIEYKKVDKDLHIECDYCGSRMASYMAIDKKNKVFTYICNPCKKSKKAN